MTKINLDSKTTNLIIGGGAIFSVILFSFSSLYVAYRYGYNIEKLEDIKTLLENKLNNTVSEAYSSGFSAGYVCGKNDKENSNKLVPNSLSEELHPLAYYYNYIIADEN
jgi:hypothetical protein